MSGPVGLDVVLARVSAPGTEYSNRLGKLESMLRVAVSDMERILRMAARAEGASEEGLEERVRIVAGAAVRTAAQRAVDEHRSAVRAAGRAGSGSAEGM